MKKCGVRLARVLKYGSLGFLVVACLWHFGTAISAEKIPVSTNADDLTACRGQLNTIYGALQEYQRRNQSLPRWLSDLVPELIHDPNTLVCPFVRNTGNLKKWREKSLLGGTFKDPGPDCSYSYEFCTQPWTSSWTTRTYKERQMEVIGLTVPIVRCLAHRPVLNLGFDGSFYPSRTEWENSFITPTNYIPLKEQTAVLHNVVAFTDISGNRLVSKLSRPRTRETDSSMLDLSTNYNATLLHLSQIDQNGELLTPYPEGPQKIGGIDFDVRGLVHASGARFPVAFPDRVKIPVQRKCASVHFLHGTTSVVTNGTRIGKFVIGFRQAADARSMRAVIPIIYGTDVRARWFDPDQTSGPESPRPAWITPPDKAGSGKSLRLYTTSWKNEHPESEIESIDFVSERTESAPFLLAITVE